VLPTVVRVRRLHGREAEPDGGESLCRVWNLRDRPRQILHGMPMAVLAGYSSGSQAISCSDTCWSPSIFRSLSVRRPQAKRSSCSAVPVAEAEGSAASSVRGVQARRRCGPTRGARSGPRWRGSGWWRPRAARPPGWSCRCREIRPCRRSRLPSASAARRLRRAGRRGCAPAPRAPGAGQRPRHSPATRRRSTTPSTRLPRRPRAAHSAAARSTRRTRPAAPRGRAVPPRHPCAATRAVFSTPRPPAPESPVLVSLSADAAAGHRWCRSGPRTESHPPAKAGSR